MFIPRSLTPLIKKGATQVPVVAIVGPRQSGKSTLAREIFKSHTYLDMQDATLLEFATTDPKGFLRTYANEHGIIIDEAQYAPQLFAQIKVEADILGRPGYFVLSGSQNFLLHEKISESLAGRVYFYHLLPFSIAELSQVDLLSDNAAAQIIKGFYPRVYQSPVDAHEYYANYIVTYVERDIRMIRNVESLTLFKKFMQLCALRVGQLLNMTDIARDCGISVSTARSWLSLLETSFIVFQLTPYHNNLNKRLIKSPKLYFYDVGLAAALMDFDETALQRNRTVYGGLFENMVIVDLMKSIGARGLRPAYSFLRDSNQNEIDLIIEHAGRVMPIEIKASETMHKSFFETLHWFKDTEKRSSDPIVIYGGREGQMRSQGSVVVWNQIEKIAKKL